MSHGSKKFLRQIVSVTPIPEHWDTFTICRKIFYESQPTVFQKDAILYISISVISNTYSLSILNSHRVFHDLFKKYCR